MKYKIDGREATQEEARDAIRDAIPNGGVEFLENTIRNCQREGLESVALHIGAKKTIEIIFE